MPRRRNRVHGLTKAVRLVCKAIRGACILVGIIATVVLTATVVFGAAADPATRMVLVLLVVSAILVSIASIRSGQGEEADATRHHGGPDPPEDDRHDDQDNFADWPSP